MGEMRHPQSAMQGKEQERNCYEAGVSSNAFRSSSGTRRKKVDERLVRLFDDPID
jgi:hypothetical protein